MSNKKIKRIISIVLCLMIIISSTACSKNDNQNNKETEAIVPEVEEEILPKYDWDSSVKVTPEIKTQNVDFPILYPTTNDNGIDYIQYTAFPTLQTKTSETTSHTGATRTLVSTGLGSIQEIAEKIVACNYEEMYPHRSITYSSSDVFNVGYTSQTATLKGDIRLYDDIGNYIHIYLEQDCKNFSDTNLVDVEMHCVSEVDEKHHNFITATLNYALGDIGSFMVAGKDIDGITWEDNQESNDMFEKLEITEDLNCTVSREYEDETDMFAECVFDSNINPYGTDCDTTNGVVSLQISTDDVFSNISISPTDDAVYNEFNELASDIPLIESVKLSSIRQIKADQYEFILLSYFITLTDGGYFNLKLSMNYGDKSEPAYMPDMDILADSNYTSISREEFLDIFKTLMKNIKPDMEFTEDINPEYPEYIPITYILFDERVDGNFRITESDGDFNIVLQ